MCRIFVSLLLLISVYLPSFGQPGFSVRLLEDSLQKHPFRDTLRIQVLNQLAFANYYSNPLQSLRYAFEARNLSDSLAYTKGEAEAYRQVGLAYWAQADLSTALNYFLTGLRIAEQHNHRQVQADINANIGTTYNGLGDSREALRFLNKSIGMQRELKNEWREAAVMNNVGDAYLSLKNYDSAAYAYSFALTKAKQQNYLLGVTTNLRNLGNVDERQNEYDSALLKYAKCIELSTSIADNRGIILSNKSMASVYLKLARFSQAEEFATRALRLALKANLKAFIRDVYELLAMISEQRGDHIHSFAYFKKYVAYKDSVQNLKTLSEANAQRLRFETDKKLSEIQLLKKESEFQSAQVTLKNNQLTMASLVVIVCILFLGFTIRNYQKERARNQLLQEKNLEIEQQRKEIDEHRKRIVEINNNLESIVEQRTHLLEQQNHRLAEYAHFNAHKLRAPVASILGLVALFQKEGATNQELQELVPHLKRSAENLDEVIKSINATLEDGMDVYKS